MSIISENYVAFDSNRNRVASELITGLALETLYANAQSKPDIATDRAGLSHRTLDSLAFYRDTIASAEINAALEEIRQINDLVSYAEAQRNFARYSET